MATIPQIKTKDYFTVGTKEDIVISNSYLTALEPTQGGSPQKAIAFFDVHREDTASLSNGRLVHLYCEKAEQFHISKAVRPGNTMGELADNFHKFLFSPDLDNLCSLHNINTEITSILKTPSGRATQILDTQKAFEDLTIQLYSKLNITAENLSPDRVIKTLRLARKIAAAYTTYNEKTVVDNLRLEALDYIEELQKLDGKISLTLAEKKLLDGVVKNLKADSQISRYFALSGNFDENYILKEWDIYFKLLDEFKAKARLDNVYIDFHNKTIYINDLKTTSKPLSLFQESVEYYKYYRQLAFYKLALKRAIEKETLWKDQDPFIVFDYKELATYKIVCQIIAVEITDNYDCCIFNVDDYMDKATLELSNLVVRHKFHVTTGIWNQSMEKYKGNGVIKLKAS